MVYTRINKVLCSVSKKGNFYVFTPVEKSESGWRVSRAFGLEEVVDLSDPFNPTQREQDEALKEFGGVIPWKREMEV